MKEDSFEMLLTTVLELKMDPTAMRDWQHSDQEHKEVPSCLNLLAFVNLQAHDSKNSLRNVV